MTANGRNPRRPARGPLHQADFAHAGRIELQAVRDLDRSRRATCRTAACTALPHLVGEDPLEAYIANNLLPWSAADFAPEEGGVIDEDTYVQQGRDLERAYSLQVINYILGTLQPDTDLAMVGYPFTDEVSHQFMGLVSPTDIDGNPNPCYDVNPKFDDVTCTGRGTAHRVAAREGYIRSAYADADEKLGVTRGLMGGNPTTFAGSDHGFAPQWYAVNANKVLNDATGRRRLPAREQARAPPTAARSLRRPRTAAPASTTERPGEGLLGRRDDPDLHQPARLKSAANAVVPDVRGSADGGPERLPGLTTRRPGSRSSPRS